MSTARLICIEGIDGAGKTTLVDTLSKRLGQAGLQVVSLHLPSFQEPDLADDPGGHDRRQLTVQELAFVAYSRLYDFYLTEMVPLLESNDLLLMDRYKWSCLVRWACRDVRWSVLTALGAMAGLLPEPAHTVLLTADPFSAYRRKKDAGLALTPAETVGRRSSQSEREAFVNLQSRAIGYYGALFDQAELGCATCIDSKVGEIAVAAAVEPLIRRLL